MGRLLLLILLIVTGTLSRMGIYAQDKTPEFTRLVDSVLSLEFHSYELFENTFLPYSENEFLLQELIEKSEKAKLPAGISFGYNQLGNLNSRRSDYHTALENYSEALNVATQENLDVLRLRSLNMMGSTSLRIDSIKNALDYHTEVINSQIGKSDGNKEVSREMGKAYYGLGNISKTLGHWDLAMENYNQSLTVFKKLNDLQGLGYSYQKIGEVYEAKNNLEEALSYYQKSNQMNEVLGSERLSTINRIGIAHVWVHQGRSEEARMSLEPILNRIDILQDPELHAQVLIQYGWILSNLERYEAAETYLNEGLEIAKRYEITEYTYDANRWLHNLFEAKGDYKESMHYLKASYQIRNKIINRKSLPLIYNAISMADQEKVEIQLRMLASENKITNLQLRRNRNILLIGALIVILFSLVFYMIYRRYRESNERRVLNLEQSRLRAQMNPHFLFNSLNSIKHFIISNDSKNAAHYLNKFSKLVRKILDSSTMKEISLQEELETVELYMSIESIRFDEHIDFKVETAPEINPATVKIPSLVLQPFLENALWHGLSGKNGSKKILLKIFQDKPGYINIVIEDNGIGRAAAAKIKKQKTLNQKSLGISNTRERLANFSKMYRKSFELSLEDLYREDGTIKGTSVSLMVPTV
jgi:tetratricopeptide (TPR) repeat protein